MKSVKNLAFLFSISLFFNSCDEKPQHKGFSVNDDSPEESGIMQHTNEEDTFGFYTRPNGVLITTQNNTRLIPIYKVNKRETRNGKQFFTGSNTFHTTYWHYGHSKNNNWNHNFMPGFEAMYGFNLVNIELHNTELKTTKSFFDEPVLIKTLYYPSFTNDTLNGEHVTRDYFMVSAYTKDSNKDGNLDTDDLRKFMLFDVKGNFKSYLIPENYSVRSSQYDPQNDYMFVYAVLDENENGHHDELESVDVFWIDLKNPENRGLVK